MYNHSASICVCYMYTEFKLYNCVLGCHFAAAGQTHKHKVEVILNLFIWECLLVIPTIVTFDDYILGLGQLID